MIASTHGSETVTDGVRIIVEPEYLAGESAPDNNRYIYSYKVIVANESEQQIQILSRNWVIIDANGKRNEVRGEGVVGKQPILEPTETFEYSSWAPIETTWGTMEGSYTVRNADGRQFEAMIDRFYLVGPADSGTDSD